jgi:type I restriction enzyme R subunit
LEADLRQGERLARPPRRRALSGYKSGTWTIRFYQEVSVDRVLEAIADGRDRVLLTLATGTGKTSIAFQIAWKLFNARWNLTDWKSGAEPTRRPRILFLADRNNLADQAFNDFTSFTAFPDDALARIKPSDIRQHGRVPKNANLFFTIFQTFMSGPIKDGKPSPYFGEYPPDFFDFIVIDERHRGGANDEGNWRGIMDYFAPAVQLGLTATPQAPGERRHIRLFRRAGLHLLPQGRHQ